MDISEYLTMIHKYMYKNKCLDTEKKIVFLLRAIDLKKLNCGSKFDKNVQILVK